MSAEVERGFLEALEARHFEGFRSGELGRALRAVSSRYVEKRGETREGPLSSAVLDGRGKRAAFALYYGALHFLVIRRLIEGMDGFDRIRGDIWDLGCGSGACGAALALQSREARIIGVDMSGWALDEARWTWRTLRIDGRAVRHDVGAWAEGGRPQAVVLGWCLNELGAADRQRLRSRCAEWTAQGSRLLVVEPVSRRVAPWWEEWCDALRASAPPTLVVTGEKRVAIGAALPPRTRLLARGAGLNCDSASVRFLAC